MCIIRTDHSSSSWKAKILSMNDKYERCIKVFVFTMRYYSQMSLIRDYQLHYV